MNPIVVAATIEHAAAMAPRMRLPDADECWALARLTPIDALIRSVTRATFAWTWMVDGEPACMFGVGTSCLIGGHGVPWLLSTDAVTGNSMTFLRQYKPYLAQMRTAFPVMVNVVDARYRTCVAWLRWLGFHVYAPVPMGPDGVLFHPFEMRS